ncbi:MAG: ABC transporter substrate-binding protein [Clostridiales bacterium]|jgi:peptide/nickel transport system substrate-binding protein|nr:ABC transporter substrate-binding protein [Clostridiales bacterium]
MKKRTAALMSLLLALMIAAGACESGGSGGATTAPGAVATTASAQDAQSGDGAGQDAADGATEGTTAAPSAAVTAPTVATTAPAAEGDDILAGNPAAGKGNVFTYAQVSPPGIFNATLYTAQYDQYICDLVFDRLIRYEYGTMAFQEQMAESYSMDLEAGTIEFTLRKGIQIHGGLGELTAEDVAFTLTMICDPLYDGTHFPYYNNIRGAEAYKNGEAGVIVGIELHTAPPANPLPITYDADGNDPYKITLLYDGLTMGNLHAFATYGHILPRAYYEKESYSDFVALNLAPVGTGPYTFNQYVIDQYIELDKFPGYWKSEPNIDKVIYQCITNDGNIPALLNGTADFAEIRNIDEDLGQIQGGNAAHLDTVSTQGSTFAFIKFRVTDPVMSDIRVRQAIAYGFNRALFVETYTGGRSALTYAMAPRNSPTYPEESLFNKYEYSPEKAGALLDEAGWLAGADGWRYKDGQKLTINYTGIAENANDAMKTAMLVEDCKLIGVELIPSYYDWATYMDLVRTNPDTQMFGYAWTMSSDPYVATTLLRKDSINNDGYYDNPEFDRLVEAAKNSADEAEANELFQQAYLLINEDMPMLFMNDYTNVWVSNKRVRGLMLDTFISWPYNIADMELVQP